MSAENLLQQMFERVIGPEEFEVTEVELGRNNSTSNTVGQCATLKNRAVPTNMSLGGGGTVAKQRQIIKHFSTSVDSNCTYILVSNHTPLTI